MRSVVRSSLLLLLATAAAGISCSESPTQPKEDPAGALAIMLASPNNDDGALLLRIDAPIDSVRAAPGSSYKLIPSGTTQPVRILVHGTLTPGSELARVWVRDRAAFTGSAVAFEQVAARGTYQQRAATGYGVQLQKR